MANITRPEQLPSGLDVCIYGAGGAGVYLLSRFVALAETGLARCRDKYEEFFCR